MAARRPASTRSAEPLPPPERILISRIGSDGDGIGRLADGRTVYVPFSLPGEVLTVRPAAKRGDGFLAVIEVFHERSPDRAEPPCPHFGGCGGCSLQQWQAQPYGAWKFGFLAEALDRAGFSGMALAPLVRTQPHTRRRMDLAARRIAGKMVLGLHRNRSPDIEDLSVCPVLHPSLASLIAPLRKVLAGTGLLRREGSAIGNLVDDGVDLLLRTDAEPTAADRTRLASFAEANGVTRISWAQGKDEPEPIATLRPSIVTFSGVPVAIPPGAFLQASREGEAAIVAAVLAGLPEKPVAKARIAELYAGCGTLTFPLSQRGRVTAWEGDSAASGALRAAANASGFASRITVEARDLARRPVTAADLRGFDAVVLDPPYAGAAAQVEQIAASAVGRVMYVSCNPVSFSRDARALFQAGFRCVSATAVDQFLWSAPVESVVTFAR